MNEQDEARAELKIRKIANGWLLKGQAGWSAHNSMNDLLLAIEKALTADKDGQSKFFSPEWPRK